MLVVVVPYIGTWIETETKDITINSESVVPYIGTWIETFQKLQARHYPQDDVVPYIGTWIETFHRLPPFPDRSSYLI